MTKSRGGNTMNQSAWGGTTANGGYPPVSDLGVPLVYQPMAK